MYASGYCILPAHYLYDKEALKKIKHVSDKSHIYLIGYLPELVIQDFTQEGRQLIVHFLVLGTSYKVLLRIPDGYDLSFDNKVAFLKNAEGNKIYPNADIQTLALNKQHNILNFEVKYIGQAYGKDGNRNCIDRLLKHETLQKISLKGVPDGYDLYIVLLEVYENNKLITVMNPFAKEKDESNDRIKSGIEKLRETTEAEKTSLYEASLIRYFYLEFNKEFKIAFHQQTLKY